MGKHSNFMEKPVAGAVKCIAGCGIEIRAEDGWVCPYFCRRDDWDNTLLHKGYGPCQIDLQIGTNVCLYAPDDF